jgi:hypothetical protein
MVEWSHIIILVPIAVGVALLAVWFILIVGDDDNNAP